MILWWRHLPGVLADIAPDVRNVWVASAAAVVALIAGLTWFGWSASSPIRAAEAAVEARLEDTGLRFAKSRLIYAVPSGYRGARRRLVCGRVEDGPAFAAVVRERRERISPLSLSDGGDRVEALVIADQGPADVMAACVTVRIAAAG